MRDEVRCNDVCVSCGIPACARRTTGPNANGHGEVPAKNFKAQSLKVLQLGRILWATGPGHCRQGNRAARRAAQISDPVGPPLPRGPSFRSPHPSGERNLILVRTSFTLSRVQYEFVRHSAVVAHRLMGARLRPKRRNCTLPSAKQYTDPPPPELLVRAL